MGSCRPSSAMPWVMGWAAASSSRRRTSARRPCRSPACGWRARRSPNASANWPRRSAWRRRTRRLRRSSTTTRPRPGRVPTKPRHACAAPSPVRPSVSGRIPRRRRSSRSVRAFRWWTNTPRPWRRSMTPLSTASPRWRATMSRSAPRCAPNAPANASAASDIPPAPDRSGATMAPSHRLTWPTWCALPRFPTPDALRPCRHGSSGRRRRWRPWSVVAPRCGRRASRKSS